MEENDSEAVIDVSAIYICIAAQANKPRLAEDYENSFVEKVTNYLSAPLDYWPEEILGPISTITIGDESVDIPEQWEDALRCLRQDGAALDIVGEIKKNVAAQNRAHYEKLVTLHRQKVDSETFDVQANAQPIVRAKTNAAEKWPASIGPIEWLQRRKGWALLIGVAALGWLFFVGQEKYGEKAAALEASASSRQPKNEIIASASNDEHKQPASNASPTAAENERPAESCFANKVATFRRERGEEALIRHDMLREWESECTAPAALVAETAPPALSTPVATEPATTALAPTEVTLAPSVELESTKPGEYSRAATPKMSATPTEPLTLAIRQPDKQVAAAGLAAKPAGIVRLEESMIIGKTWVYAHPLDEARFGNVELTFSDKAVRGMNSRSSTSGTWKLADGVMCAHFDSEGWHPMCLALQAINGNDMELRDTIGQRLLHARVQ